MVVYYYNHDIAEIKEDLPYLDTEESFNIGCRFIYGGRKGKPITMLHHCDHCNNTLVGRWEYVDKYMNIEMYWRNRKDFEGKTSDLKIYNEITEFISSRKKLSEYWFETNRTNEEYLLFGDKCVERIDDYTYDIGSFEVGKVIHFKLNEKRKELLEPVLSVSPKIIKYREEIKDFFSMEVCPICGRKFERKQNHHAFFIDSPKDLEFYDEFCEIYPDAFWEIYSSYDQVDVSKISEDFYNNHKDSAFVYNNCLVKNITRTSVIDAYGGGYKKVYRLRYYDISSLDSIIEFFKNFHKSKFIKEADLKIKSLTDNFNVMPVAKSFDKKILDTENLKKHLEWVSRLEGNVFSVTERLKDLYLVHFESEKAAMSSQLLLTLDLKKKLDEIKEEYKKTESINPEDSISLEDFPCDYPEKPKAPEMPQQPILKSPGLFNKKKVEAENNLLAQEYQAKLAAYNVKMELFAEELKKYNRIVEEMEEKQKGMYSARVEEVLKKKQVKLDKLNLEVSELEKEINEYESVDSDIVTPEKIINNLIESEIREAEKTLCETYKALNELYSYDIIFSKYRNFVGVSTFFEYLSAGRCATLEGADGAYNIYETEIRSNQIISQLSQVITSLDEIQQNQFVICSAIQESNRTLFQLSSSMNSAVSALNSIDITTKNMSATMDKIEKNAAISAYNSSVTAYYSKKNAELTNALGYMVAFSR